jgi:CubicO group peptidase (beta-lactamase class C family)
VDEADLTALLQEHAARHSVPGAVIGILRHGATTIASYGLADVITEEAVTAETRFSPGSLTKSMVATVVARLADAGRLSLDDPVAAHVPELRRIGWAERATVRHLLANRSGLPLTDELEFGFAKRKEWAGDDALSRLAADVAAADPVGGAWSYSNVGWCLLGRVIETATGSVWEEAMRRHLFDGAGMRATTFPGNGVPELRASGHELTADGLVPVEPLSGRAFGPAGATLVSTVPDLLRFAELHLHDPSLAVLREAHADVSIYEWLDAWCLGWARFDWRNGPVWGWDGLISGERSILRMFPEQRAAVVLMTNGGTGRAMYRSLFADLMEPLFGNSMPPLRLDPVPGSAGDLSRFAGVYAWPDRRVEVAATREGLLISEGDGAQEAFPLDERTFLVDPLDPDNPTVTFGAFDGGGRPQVLYVMLWGLPRMDVGQVR